MDECECREILDFSHNPSVALKEDEVYQIEGQLTDFFKNKNAVSALSLAMLLSRNPSENDKWDRLKDVFAKADH